MSFLGDLFFSEIINAPVINQRGEEVGRLTDISVIPGNPFPQVSGISMKSKKEFSFVPLQSIDIMNKKIISIHAPEKSSFPQNPPEGHIFIRDQLLDKQIVDINGVKIVRVNDIKLGELKKDYCLVGLDVGFHGLMRRIGLEWKGTAGLIPWNYVQPLEEGLSQLTLTLSRQGLAQMHPVDIADIIAQVSSKERAVLLDSLDKETAGEAIHELDADMRVAIVEQMGLEEAADVLEKMQPDEAADIIGDLSEETAKAILDRMEKEEAADVEELLEHDEDSAGGLMTTEYLAFSPEKTAAQAIEELRQQSPETELIYYIYLVDQEEHLLGVLSLRDLIMASAKTPLSELMRSNPKRVTAEANQKDVAELVSKYNLIAVPVVDEEDHLLGIITVDDILNILLPSSALKRY
ncbi:MAG TPA: CBS domain-containing protein [Thermodesulfobacteriota bacterium]|nr:CBS domain-containing protein [Thermodesulfobacteriota bacterium]